MYIWHVEINKLHILLFQILTLTVKKRFPNYSYLRLFLISCASNPLVVFESLEVNYSLLHLIFSSKCIQQRFSGSSRRIIYSAMQCLPSATSNDRAFSFSGQISWRVQSLFLLTAQPSDPSGESVIPENSSKRCVAVCSVTERRKVKCLVAS